MRMQGLILSSLILLALLASNEQAQGQSMVDAYIEGTKAPEVYKNPYDNYPATPQEARELQKNKGALNWTMPSTLSAGGESAKESRGQTEETGAPAAESIASDSQTSPAQTEMVDVKGNWFFTLNDSLTRELALTLLQDGGNVYGSGRIREGNSSMDVAVSGTAAGSDLKLDLVSTSPILQYQLNLTVDQDLAAGEYKASSASGESWTGMAEGQKTA
jgi:hypothetical protein